MKALVLAGFLILLLPYLPMFAQDTEKRDTGADPGIVRQTISEENIFTYKPRWGVGMQAGLLSGIGLGVRFHPVSRFAAQLIGGGIKLGDRFYASVGAEGQFDLDVMSDSRLYALLGLGYYSNGGDDDKKLKDPFRLGLGIGYEWAISSKMVFYGSLDFTYFPDSGGFLPLPQVGIFYYFK